MPNPARKQKFPPRWQLKYVTEKTQLLGNFNTTVKNKKVMSQKTVAHQWPMHHKKRECNPLCPHMLQIMYLKEENVDENKFFLISLAFL